MGSVSKSVTSLLTGIAIDRKLIANVEAPVVKFFAEYAALKAPDWDRITLRNLLTMSSGSGGTKPVPGTTRRTTSPTSGVGQTHCGTCRPSRLLRQQI